MISISKCYYIARGETDSSEKNGPGIANSRDSGDIWQVSYSPVVDFDGTGTVDIKDLQRLIEFFGSRRAPAGHRANTLWQWCGERCGS